jgi:flagellar hook assembly protein FlgD
VSVRVYNEAGEEVAVLTEGMTLEDSVREFEFADGVDSITEARGIIGIVFPETGDRAAVTVVWDGTDGGQPLANGSYIVKVESVDSSGVLTVATGTASILRAESKVTVRIFNEAGELVFSRQLAAGSVQQSEVEIQGSVVDPSLPPGVPGSTLNLVLGTLNLGWSGRDDSGRILANGSYIVEIHIESGQNEILFTETVTVLSSWQQAAGSLQIIPNPASGAAPVEIRIPAGSTGGTARIYTVSGELVRRIEFAGDSVLWDLTDRTGSRAASGVYLVLAEFIGSDGHVSRSLARLVIIR